MKHTKIFLSSIFSLATFVMTQALPVSAATSDASFLSFYPVDKEKIIITQYFRAPHGGMDLAPRKKGEQLEIYAAGDGTVIYAGVCSEGWCKKHGGVVVIKHVNGYRTLYAHLSDIRVTEHERVQKGKAIGTLGDSGFATGPILHFEICKTYCSATSLKAKVDPSRYFSFSPVPRNGAK
jgi:murein DD-endopeptidase MepM/ murein hydrolase activator NlpD